MATLPNRERKVNLTLHSGQTFIVFDEPTLANVTLAVQEWPEACEQCDNYSCTDCAWAREYEKVLKERLRQVRKGIRKMAADVEAQS